MDTPNLQSPALPTDLKPEHRFDFLRLDYESGMKLVEQKHDLKLGYLKFYITTISVLSGFSVFLLKLGSAGGDTLITIFSYGITMKIAAGFNFLLLTIIGFVVAKNLAAIRTNEVFATNAILYVRNRCIREFGLGPDYPTRSYARSVNRQGSDYITILACSGLNCLIMIAGLVVMFSERDGLMTIIVSAFGVALYWFFHYQAVEMTLKEADKEFTKAPVSLQ